jgi:hypothetical protein
LSRRSDPDPILLFQICPGLKVPDPQDWFFEKRIPRAYQKKNTSFRRDAVYFTVKNAYDIELIAEIVNSNFNLERNSVG